MNRRACLAAVAGAACLVFAPPAAAAYPDKPIKVIVAWPAGGLVDIPIRLVAEKLRAALGQAVVVDNRVGEGGNLGADAVAKAAPDGYTLLVTTSAVVINKAMQQPMPFDPQKDLQPVVHMASAPLILVTLPKGPASVAGLLAMARTQPGGLRFASAGNGSPAHLAGEWLKSLEKIDGVHIPYQGAPLAMEKQLAGLVDFHFSNVAVALPQIRAGKVVALAVASPTRFALLPDVPTMEEAGVPDFNINQWIGLFAPKGTPAELVGRLNKAVEEALASPDVRVPIEQNGMTVAKAATPQQFTREVARDLNKWTEIVIKAGIKAQ